MKTIGIKNIPCNITAVAGALQIKKIDAFSFGVVSANVDLNLGDSVKTKISVNLYIQRYAI